MTGVPSIRRLKALGRVDPEVGDNALDASASISGVVGWGEDIWLVILILIFLLGLLFWHLDDVVDVNAEANLSFDQ